MLKLAAFSSLNIFSALFLCTLTINPGAMRHADAMLAAFSALALLALTPIASLYLLSEPMPTDD